MSIPDPPPGAPEPPGPPGEPFPTPAPDPGETDPKYSV